MILLDARCPQCLSPVLDRDGLTYTPHLSWCPYRSRDGVSA